MLSSRVGLDVLHLQAMPGHADLTMPQQYAQVMCDDLLLVDAEHSPIDRPNSLYSPCIRRVSKAISPGLPQQKPAGRLPGPRRNPFYTVRLQTKARQQAGARGIHPQSLCDTIRSSASGPAERAALIRIRCGPCCLPPHDVQHDPLLQRRTYKRLSSPGTPGATAAKMPTIEIEAMRNWVWHETGYRGNSAFLGIAPL
jgi:hypothetical protein